MSLALFWLVAAVHLIVVGHEYIRLIKIQRHFIRSFVVCLALVRRIAVQILQQPVEWLCVVELLYGVGVEEVLRAAELGRRGEGVAKVQVRQGRGSHSA